MAKVLFEQEICDYCNLPSIPKKEWNGKDSFRRGVAVTRLVLGGYAYAVCTFDSEKDSEPRIIKTFANETFCGFDEIFVVPNYMETDVSQMDLDEESKKKAQLLVQEADELTEDEDDEELDEMKKLPEWVFPEITSKEEAVAWLTDYNKRNRIKGRVSQNEESIKMRLLNIYSQQKSKKGRK